MPKIYSDETLAMIWQAIDTEKKTLRRVATELNTTMQEINKLYAAAYKKFYRKIPVTRKGVSVDTRYNNKPAAKLQRPTAEYSNTSPYRIARPGLTR